MLIESAENTFKYYLAVGSPFVLYEVENWKMTKNIFGFFVICMLSPWKKFFTNFQTRYYDVLNKKNDLLSTELYENINKLTLN